MKTYRETSDEVFEKIGEYERAKKRRRRAALRVCGGVAAFALVLSLPSPLSFALSAARGVRARTEKPDTAPTSTMSFLRTRPKNLPGKTLRQSDSLSEGSE